MAKQKKFKKIQMPKVQKMQWIGMVIFIIFVISAWLLTKAFLQRSDYFRLRSVEFRGAADRSLVAVKSEMLANYKDRNIFKIDLKAIASGLAPRYPDAKDIVVKRVLPDKLFVALNFRKPVAILSNGRNFPVDRDGVILVNRDLLSMGDLPVIKGVEAKYAGRFRKKCESSNLKAALELIDVIKRTRFLDKYRVKTLDASDMRSMSFALGEGGPTIIIGYENLKERLEALHDTLRDPRLVLDSISYIDVRFKDIAISPK
ncbi:MAG: cell division protein FtsQ/DivIB [Candidatus Omnitrophota bacterium]|nr:cell division protein FtsQ/DivIB [Candidatus Omnitrophota bacterium]